MSSSTQPPHVVIEPRSLPEGIDLEFPAGFPTREARRIAGEFAVRLDAREDQLGEFVDHVMYALPEISAVRLSRLSQRHWRELTRAALLALQADIDRALLRAMPRRVRH